MKPNYDNSTVRRHDRLLSEEAAMALLQNGEYGILSMQSETGAYGIPLSYAWDGNNSIYFHCAPEGHKLHLLARNPNASFCVVGHTHVLPEKFTTEYECIVAEGIMHINLPADERMHALELILDKYAPNDKTIGMQYAEKSFHRTNIMRLDMERMSGKCKKVNR